MSIGEWWRDFLEFEIFIQTITHTHNLFFPQSNLFPSKKATCRLTAPTVWWPMKKLQLAKTNSPVFSFLVGYQYFLFLVFFSLTLFLTNIFTSRQEKECLTCWCGDAQETGRMSPDAIAYDNRHKLRWEFCHFSSCRTEFVCFVTFNFFYLSVHRNLPRQHAIPRRAHCLPLLIGEQGGTTNSKTPG